MKITVDLPDETASRMLGEGSDVAPALLELAGYTTCVNGRISEYEFMKLLGLESRFDLHAIMKRIQSETESLDPELVHHDLASIAQMDGAHQSSKSG
jgi:hypothetical protein